MEFLAVLERKSVSKLNREESPSIKRIAYLVCYYRSRGCSCICRNDHTLVIYTSYNGCTCACSLWERNTASMQGCIAVVIAEIETRHIDLGGGFASVVGRIDNVGEGCS